MRLLKQSEIFLFTSSVETFPVSILEGLVNSKYIISTETDPVKTMLGDNANYFSFKIPGELEQRINEAIKLNMGKKQIHYTSNIFNYVDITKNTFKYFNYLINKSK